MKKVLKYLGIFIIAFILFYAMNLATLWFLGGLRYRINEVEKMKFMWQFSGFAALLEAIILFPIYYGIVKSFKPLR